MNAPLPAAAFVDFGEVVEDKTAPQVKIINDNTTRRFDNLAAVDTARAGDRTALSLFRATPRPQPIVIGMLERHPLGSHAFMPASNAEWLVGATGDETPNTRRCAVLSRAVFKESITVPGGGIIRC